MKSSQSNTIADAGKLKLWQKTSYANLIRYVPSGVCFCESAFTAN